MTLDPYRRVLALPGVRALILLALLALRVPRLLRYDGRPEPADEPEASHPITDPTPEGPAWAAQ